MRNPLWNAVGIMALPQAVATLGVVLGGLLIFIVFILSYWTINILARSAQIS